MFPVTQQDLVGGGRGRNSASRDNGKILAATCTRGLATGLDVPTVTRRDCTEVREAQKRVCEGNHKPKSWIGVFG